MAATCSKQFSGTFGHWIARWVVGIPRVVRATADRPVDNVGSSAVWLSPNTVDIQ